MHLNDDDTTLVSHTDHMIRELQGFQSKMHEATTDLVWNILLGNKYLATQELKALERYIEKIKVEYKI